jgi:hypothetical protein
MKFKKILPLYELLESYPLLEIEISRNINDKPICIVHPNRLFSL